MYCACLRMFLHRTVEGYILTCNAGLQMKEIRMLFISVL